MGILIGRIANKKTYKNYLFFWSGQLFSLLGSSIVFFVLIWWISVETRDPVLLATATFLRILPMTIFLPIAGVFSDRLDRKKLILVADSSQAFITFLLILSFLSGLANVWIIMIVISLRSICQAFHIPTVNAIIPSMVPEEKLTRINGINFLFTGIIGIFAQLIASVLWIIFPINPENILWIDVITFFIAIIPLLLIKIPSVRQNNEKEELVEKDSFLKEFRLGFKALKVIPGLLIMIILGMLTNFLIRPLVTLLPLFVSLTHGGGTLHYALSLAFLHGGTIIGAIATSIKKKWPHKIRIIFASTIIIMVGYLVIALAPKGLFFIIFMGGIVVGITMPLINSLFQTFMQTVVPKDKLGRVTSIDWFLSNLMSPIGVIISGPLALILGIPNLLIYSAIIGLIIPVSLWSFTKIRKLDYDDEAELKKIIEEVNNI
ncbi:MAG: MFS transporter [Promethearchaeota archaeon]